MPAYAPSSKPEIIPDPRTDAVAQNLERLAWLMDRAITIPGTKISVGLDAILGLIPGGGDFLCGLIQSGLVLSVLKHYRVPKVVAARMVANVLIDLAVGTIPGIGDLFDIEFKANTRNMALLGQVRQLQAKGQPIPSAPSVWYLVGIATVLLTALGLLFVGLVAIAAIVWKAVTR